MSILNDYQNENDPRNSVPPIVPPPAIRVDTPPALQPLTEASQALDSRDALITPNAVQADELMQGFNPVDALETQIPDAPPDFSAFQTREEIMEPFDQQAQAELTQFFTQAADDAAQADIVNSHLPTLFGGMSAADRAMADRYASRIGELITSSNRVVEPPPTPFVSPQQMGPMQANRPFGFDQDNLASPKKTLGNPFMMDDKDKSEFAPKRGKFGQFGEGPLGAAFYGLNAVFGTPVAGIVDLANAVYAGHTGNLEALQTDVDAKNPVDWAIKKSKLAKELGRKNLAAQYPTGQTFAQQTLAGRDLGSLGASLNGAEEDAYAKRYGSLSPLAYGLDTIIGTKDEDYDELYASKLPKYAKDGLATFKGLARTATGLFVDVVVAPDNIGDLARPLAKAVKQINRSIGMAQQLPYGQFTPKPAPFSNLGSPTKLQADTKLQDPGQATKLKTKLRSADTKIQSDYRTTLQEAGVTKLRNAVAQQAVTMLKTSTGADRATMNLEQLRSVIPGQSRVTVGGGTAGTVSGFTLDNGVWNVVVEIEPFVFKTVPASHVELLAPPSPSRIIGTGRTAADVPVNPTRVDPGAAVVGLMTPNVIPDVEDVFRAAFEPTPTPVPDAPNLRHIQITDLAEWKALEETRPTLDDFLADTEMLPPAVSKVGALPPATGDVLDASVVSPQLPGFSPAGLLPPVKDVVLHGADTKGRAPLQLAGSMPIASLPPAVRRAVTRPSAITNEVLIPPYVAPGVEQLRELSLAHPAPTWSLGATVGSTVETFNRVRRSLDEMRSEVNSILIDAYNRSTDKWDWQVFKRFQKTKEEIQPLIDDVASLISVDSLRVHANTDTADAVHKLDYIINELPNKPANIKNVLIGHGSGRHTDGTWTFGDYEHTAGRISVQDYIDLNYPKGARVHVLSCETCAAKTIGGGWEYPNFVELTSRGEDVAKSGIAAATRAKSIRNAIKRHGYLQATKADLLDPKLDSIDKARLGALLEAQTNKFNKALEELGINPADADDFFKHVESGKDPELFVSQQVATSQPAVVRAAQSASDTLTPAADASDASGIITVKPGESQAPVRIEPGDTKREYPSTQTFDALVDSKVLGLVVSDKLDAASKLQATAAHMAKGKSLDEAVALVNSGEMAFDPGVERVMFELHQEARKRLGLDPLVPDIRPSGLREAIKQYRFKVVRGEVGTERIADYIEDVRRVLGLDSLRFADTKSDEDVLRTMLSLLDQSAMGQRPSNIRNILMGHGSGTAVGGDWKVTKSDDTVWETVSKDYPEGTTVHVYACEDCFKRKLDSPYFWDGFVGVTSSAQPKPVSVSLERFYKAYSPKELPQLIAESSQVPGMKFNGKASIPQSRPAKVIHRLASLIPHPDGSGAPLLAPLKADVEAFVSRYGVPHPFADYAKAAPRILTGGGGKRKGIVDLAADIGNLYGSFYQRLLSPSGEPISDELLEALESGHATGKGILLDLNGENAIRVEAPKVEPEAPKPEVNLEELRTQKVNEYATTKGVAPELVVITDGNNGKLNWSGKGQPNFSVFGTAEQAAAKRAKLTDAPSAQPFVSPKMVDLDKLMVTAQAKLDNITNTDDLYKLFEKIEAKVEGQPGAEKFMAEFDDMVQEAERKLTHPFGEFDTKALDDLADEVATVVANETELAEALEEVNKAEAKLLDDDAFTWDYDDWGSAAAPDMNPGGSGASITIEGDSVTKSGLEPEQYEAEVQALKLLGGEEAPKLISASDGTVVMEKVEGTLLSQLNIVSYSDGEDLGAKVGQLLASVHNKGVVHNDMHWNNLILTDSGTLKLIDFNLASTKSQMSEDIWSRSISNEVYKAELYPEVTGEALEGYLKGFKAAYESFAPPDQFPVTDDYSYLQKLLQDVNKATATGEEAKDFLAQYKDALVKAGTDARAQAEGLTDQLFDAFDALRKAQRDASTNTRRVQLEEGKRSYKSDLDQAANDNGVC